MRKILKRFSVCAMAALLSISAGVSAMGVSAYYAEVGQSRNIDSSEYLSSDEQFDLFVKSGRATPEKIAEYKKMADEHKRILSGETVAPYASSKSLNVPFYEQEESYYCGPATVRQVCAFLNKTSNPPSQKTIAKALGTTTGGTDQQAIINYLNSHCPKTYETLWKNGAYTSASALYNLILGDINENKPTVAHIKTTSSDWKYATSGHYLCFEGYADDTSSGGHTVYVVDPWLRGHHIASGKYAVSREKLYAVTDRIGS